MYTYIYVYTHASLSLRRQAAEEADGRPAREPEAAEQASSDLLVS